MAIGTYVFMGALIVFILVFFCAALLMYARKSRYKHTAIILNLNSSGNVTYETARYAHFTSKGKQEWRLYKGWLNIFKKIELPPIPNRLEIPNAKKPMTNVCLFIGIDRDTFVPAPMKMLANQETGSILEKFAKKVLATKQATVKVDGEEHTTDFMLVDKEKKIYTPSAIFFDVNSVELSANFQLAKEFLATQHKKHMSMFSDPSWWDKYGNQAVFITAMILSIVVLVVVLNSDVATSGLAQIAPQQVGVFDKVGGALG